MRIIFTAVGAFLVALGLYGFATTSNLSVDNFTGLHNVYHLVSGILVLWLAYANRYIVATSRILGVFYIALIFDSFVSHHMIEWHTIYHTVLAAVFLALGFFAPGALGFRKSGSKRIAGA